MENFQPIPARFLSEILDQAIDDLSDRRPCPDNSNTAAAGAVNPELARDKSEPLLPIRWLMPDRESPDAVPTGALARVPRFIH